MKWLPAIAWVAMLPMPVAGQEPVFDFAPTEECLEGAEADLACIGRAADQCIESPGGSSTVGMGFCLAQEWNAWDDRLNAAFQKLKSVNEGQDREFDELDSAAPRLVPALVVMQRAWIAYRDAACDYERAHWGGGTGAGPATAQCLMMQTAQQTLVLEQRLREWHDK